MRAKAEDIAMTDYLWSDLDVDAPDPDPIPMEHVRKICRIGQGRDCCRYLLGGASGFECGKNRPPMSDEIDRRADTGEWLAAGDNCPGMTPPPKPTVN